MTRSLRLGNQATGYHSGIGSRLRNRLSHAPGPSSPLENDGVTGRGQQHRSVSVGDREVERMAMGHGCRHKPARSQQKPQPSSRPPHDKPSEDEFVG